MVDGIFNSFLNRGKDALNSAEDFIKGKGEDIYNIFETGKDLLGDSGNAIGSLFTGDDTLNKFQTIGTNFMDNVANTYIDHKANTLNNINNIFKMGTNGIEDIANGIDSIYKPEEDNFQNLDNGINTLHKIEDITESVHDNIDPLKNFTFSLVNIAAEGDILNNFDSALNESLKQDDFSSGIKTFGTVILSGTLKNAINKAIDSEEKEQLKDEEISNTKQYNGLTNQNMLLLSNISYSPIANANNKGKTLREIINEQKEKLKSENDNTLLDANGNFTAEGAKALADSGFSMQTEDYELYAQMLNDIANNEQVASLTILDNADIDENYINATTYGHLDSNGKLIDNPTVVYQGTSNATAWEDNATGLNTEDTPLQKAAYEYIKRQQATLKEYSNNPSDIHITVSGHSKGGNFAMYSTIMNEKEEKNNPDGNKITIDNCLSFDGQGFNKDFVKENKKIINKCKNKMTSINAYTDAINLLLTEVSGKTHQVGVEYTKLKRDEEGNPILSGIEDLNNFLFDTHSPTTMYKAICENENNKWSIYEKNELASQIHNISNSVEDTNEPMKAYLTKTLEYLLVNQFAPGQKVRDKDSTIVKEATIDDYNLIIAKTDDNKYNVYNKDGDVVIAQIDENKQVTKGAIEQYEKDDSDNELLQEIDKTIDTLNC